MQSVQNYRFWLLNMLVLTFLWLSGSLKIPNTLLRRLKKNNHLKSRGAHSKLTNVDPLDYRCHCNSKTWIKMISLASASVVSFDDLLPSHFC